MEFNPLVSFYPNAYENLPTEIEAAKFIANIKGGTYAGLVKEIRQRFQTAIDRSVPNEDAKKAVDSLKKKLGSVTLAGIQPMRGNKFTPQFTGLIQADLDLLGDRLGYIRELLESDPHVFALFVSATGEGIKAFYRIPRCKNADEYKFAFDTLAAHVLKFTGCKIDELKEVARLCYASHDPDCRHNPNATELSVDFAQMPPPVEPKAERVKLQPSTVASSTRSQIAERILGAIDWTDGATGFCKCPGEHLHTNGNAPKDCRVTLDGVPTVFCLHKSCLAAVETANHDLRSQIGRAEFVPISTRSGVAGDPPDTANHFKSDVGYGDAFVQRHAKTIRYCADEKIWLVFDDVSGWRRDETGTAIKSLAADYARELYQAALIEAATKEPEIGKRIISNAAALGNKKRIDPALSFAACNPAVVVRAEQLDADHFLVGVQNGVVNLAKGTFQAHRREHLVTRRLAVNYDANATAPTWEKFLAEVQPEKEMREFLQRLCGYALTGEIREHVLPFHYGTGANGKGTFPRCAPRYPKAWLRCVGRAFGVCLVV